MDDQCDPDEENDKYIDRTSENQVSEEIVAVSYSIFLIILFTICAISKWHCVIVLLLLRDTHHGLIQRYMTNTTTA